MNQLDAPLKASGLIGLKIENSENQKIGSVHDLAVDLQSGRIVQAILSMGGVLSMGDRLIAVPPQGAPFHSAGKPLRFDSARERVKGAPVFEMSHGWSSINLIERRKRTAITGMRLRQDPLHLPANSPPVRRAATKSTLSKRRRN
ncbi:MAG: PRC-barrel domain-containing protein [Undibacterium sp.]|nr:PRC-barrel domain-containing protein [Opitutaceae bacterium]